MSDKWYVYKRTMSNVCTVQLETAIPHLGEKHLGPFETKAEATRAMCADVDDSLTDQSHCWTVSPATVCSSLNDDDQSSAHFKAASPMARLTLNQIKTLVKPNNHSSFSDELVISICWAESSFDPNAAAGGNSTSVGLMMVNQDAIDTVNANTPAGTHFEYGDMTDAAKAVACGSWYLRVISDHAGNGDKRETLRIYRGASPRDYTYADKVIRCELCLQSPDEPQTCLNQIHP